MKSTIKNASKTILSSLVIFQMVFTTAAMPVVTFAFEEEVQAAQEEIATEAKEEASEESKVEVSETTDETNPVKEEGSADDTSVAIEDPATDTSGDATEVASDEEGADTLAKEEAAPEVAPLAKGLDPRDPPKDGGVCDTNGNILVNGSFEDPAVENSSWNIYTSVPGWSIEWMPGSGEGYEAQAEIHRGLWSAYDGEQYIELDSDFDGPEGAIFDEAGSTKISQVIDTVPGVTYTIKFAFSARPGTPASDNHMALYIDDVVWDDSINTDGSSNSNTEWFVFTREFTAVDYTTKISFADIGDADSYGTFIDKVSVSCGDDEPENPEECPAGVISARINFSKVAKGAQVNGWRNWGEGDFAPQVFVGGNTPAHQYDDEEWFPLTNPDGSYINDPDIASYRDVKGLAVQRMEGKIRVVLYGFHPTHNSGSKAAKPVDAGKDKPESKIEFDEVVSEVQSKEFTQFAIQLSHAGFGGENSQISPMPWAGDMSPMGGWSNVGANPRNHNPAINDVANPMDGRGDYGAYINQYNPRFDRMRTFDPFRVHSVLVVTTGSDGFYASYDITPDSEKDCGSEDDDPVITLPEIGCVETSVTSYDFMNLPGVSVSGGVGTVTLSVDQSGVQFGTPGLYTITYTAIDAQGNIDEEMMLITIGDCDNGNGGDEPGIQINDFCVLFGTDFPMSAVTVTGDAEGLTLEIFDLNTFNASVPGVYPLTFTLEDSEGNVVVGPFVYNFEVAEQGDNDCDNGTGGGDDDNPVLTIPADACYETGFEGFNQVDGVSAVDFAGDPIVLVLGTNLEITGTPDFSGDVASFQLTYKVTDPFGSDTETRTITVSDDCDNGGNGGDGDGDGNGGNGGGGSSSGSRGGRNRGEVLGAETGPACIRFTEYYDTGDTGGEIRALQIFLNEYLGTNLVVNGIYDVATTQAVHDFQAMHWDDIIDPWTPPLSPNTTGRFYKTTRATVNAIIDCPEAAVYLEDPQTMFEITSVADQKEFDADAIAKVTEALAGEVLGVVEGK